MNSKTRPKLHWPLALLAATPGPRPFPLRPGQAELSRLVAAMVD